LQALQNYVPLVGWNGKSLQHSLFLPLLHTFAQHIAILPFSVEQFIFAIPMRSRFFLPNLPHKLAFASYLKYPIEFL